MTVLNAELTKVLDGYWRELDKFDASQMRDEHGRWTAGGGQPTEGGGNRPSHSERTRAAAGHLITHSLAAAAAAAAALDAVSSVSTMSRSSPLHILAQLHNLNQNLAALKHHLGETGGASRELWGVAGEKLQTLRDHLSNVKDHIQRLKAEASGDHERADALRRKIDLRTRAMALRGDDSTERRRPSRLSSAANVLDAAARGIFS
jgi:hypothetical protein